MKLPRFYFLFWAIAMMLFAKVSFTQTYIPQLASFSAVVNDGNNQPLINTTISLRISLYQGPTQILPPAYCAMHQGNTNENGFISIQLNRNVLSSGCNGALINDFEDIPWEIGNMWMRVEYQTSTGGSFIDLGMLEVASTYYAFAAKSAENLLGVNLDSAQNGDVLTFNDVTESWEPQTPQVPSLPAGTGGQTLYYNANGWEASSLITNSEYFGSVGIGTSTPDPSARLDISANDKGLLTPRMNTLQILNIENNNQSQLPEGLLIYDVDVNRFKYYVPDGLGSIPPYYGSWYSLGVDGQGTPGPAGPIGPEGPQGEGIASGIISMWSGTIASIPSGWVLCDGNNGTPDLTDKFIVSVASSAENPGSSAVPGAFVDVESGAVTAPDRSFFKLAYIMRQ